MGNLRAAIPLLFTYLGNSTATGPAREAAAVDTAPR